MKLSKSRTGGGVLELKVDGPAAALIQHQAPPILDRVNLYLGAGTVVKLRIVQGPLASRRRGQGRPDAPPPRRRWTPAPRRAGISLAGWPEGPLKDARCAAGPRSPALALRSLNRPLMPQRNRAH